MWYLLGDVGGTNMRLAAVDANGTITARHDLPSDGETNLQDACAAFAAHMGSPPAGVAIAAAGVIEDGQVVLTNVAQAITDTGLADACGVAKAKVFLLNDFEAAAWSLSQAEPDQVTYLQGGPQPGPRVVIGPGTGLGVGALLWHEGKPLAVPGEGGHMRLTPQTVEDIAYIEALIAEWPEVQMGDGLAVEAEAILSGTGLPKWYRAIANVHAEPAPLKKAADIFKAAHRAQDANASRAIASFAGFLGGMAGDLGLVFGARGGVFVTGGVAQANPWVFDADFIAAFNAGGRHSDWRRSLPLGLCRDPDFGLKGAGNYLFARLD